MTTQDAADAVATAWGALAFALLAGAVLLSSIGSAVRFGRWLLARIR